MTPFTSIQLRIKILSLAEEARHIRRWEKRLWKAARHHPQAGETAQSLYRHRMDEVGSEARNTLLAFGYLRGRAYKSMEPRRYSNPSWASIKAMVEKYGPAFDAQDFQAWAKAAGEVDQRFPSNAPPAMTATAALAKVESENIETPGARKKFLGIF